MSQEELNNQEYKCAIHITPISVNNIKNANAIYLSKQNSDKSEQIWGNDYKE